MVGYWLGKPIEIIAVEIKNADNKTVEIRMLFFHR